MKRRVQMKLLEARYHFEEKKAAMDMRNEPQEFLRTKKAEEKQVGS